ncbi:hypothetical protein [Streptomyces sp. NPDC092903]|uniref:hypothetical protein n=1 Tax=Streptomyces sp. NPDC092903 TaxID=3366017 RepID=UPI00382EDF89
MAASTQSQVTNSGQTAPCSTPPSRREQISTPGEYTGFVNGQITAPVPGSFDEEHSKTVALE